MKRQKGMTLIEVIISIAMLGLLTAAVLPAFPNNYKLLIATREMTQNIFDAQEDMENQIKDVKDKIRQNNLGAGIDIGNAASYTIFDGTEQRTVTGYTRSTIITPTSYMPNSNKLIYTVVADTYRVDLPVATITNVNLDVMVSGVSVDNAYADTDSLYLMASPTVDDPLGVNLTNLYRWYVSREGFYVSPETSPDEAEVGTTYPVFPDDYAIIPGETTNMLSNGLSSYAGRYIICAVTPASNSGKMGTTVQSNAIYFSGLKVTDNLMLHLDASMINQKDSAALTSDGSNIRVNKLRSLNDAALYASPVNTSFKPRYLQAQLINKLNTSDYIYMRYMSFGGSEALVTNNYINLGRNNFTAFIVAGELSGTGSNIVKQNTGWSIGLNDEEKLNFKVGNSAVNADTVISDSNWHIIRVQLYNNTLSMTLDGNTTYTAASGNVPQLYGKITLGGNITGNIGEVIVYSSIGDSEIAQVESYLKNKYSID